MKTSESECNGRRCPGCGTAATRDRKKRGFVRQGVAAQRQRLHPETIRPRRKGPSWGALKTSLFYIRTGLGRALAEFHEGGANDEDDQKTMGIAQGSRCGCPCVKRIA